MIQWAQLPPCTQLQRPWFGPELRLLSVWSFVACSFSVHVGFLWCLWFPPMSNKHTGMWIGYLKLPLQMSVHGILSYPIQDIFPPHTQCSQNKLWSHCEQYKAVTEDQLINECTWVVFLEVCLFRPR